MKMVHFDPSNKMDTAIIIPKGINELSGFLRTKKSDPKNLCSPVACIASGDKGLLQLISRCPADARSENYIMDVELLPIFN